MFNKLFKKKPTEPTLFSPATGTVLALENVADPVFASKAMGDGYAVEPVDGAIFSPIKGKVMSIFPTKHAIGLVDDEGREVLVHMGIDTVDLKGTGFDVLVTEGQAVDQATQLAEMDLGAIKEAGKATTVMVIVTNQPELAVTVAAGEHQAKEGIGTL